MVGERFGDRGQRVGQGTGLLGRQVVEDHPPDGGDMAGGDQLESGATCPGQRGLLRPAIGGVGGDLQATLTADLEVSA